MKKALKLARYEKEKGIQEVYVAYARTKKLSGRDYVRKNWG